MIRLRRLNEAEIVVNADQIMCVESTPDTIVTMMNGEKIIAKDSVDEVIQKVVEFKRNSFPLIQRANEGGANG